MKRKAQPAATSCQKSPLQRFLDDLVSCPSRVLDVCRATEDCNILATTPMSRRSIRLAAADPVSSLCSEMTKEHAFGRIKEVVASHMKKNFKPKLTTETGDVCEVTASMITFGFITGVDVLSLLSTLQQVPRQDFLENAGISFTQMTATSSTKTPSALTVGNTSLKQQDLDTLKGQAWLNDKVNDIFKTRHTLGSISSFGSCHPIRVISLALAMTGDIAIVYSVRVSVRVYGVY